MSDPSDLRLRAATAADRERVLATAARLGAFTLPAGRSAASIVAAEHNALAAAFAAGRHADDLVVAESAAGDHLGFLFLERHEDYFTGEPHGHVSMLAVVPEAEGRGVGRALMARAEEWARQRGLSHLTLNVFDTNARARALYERLGYRADTVRYRKAL